MGVACRSKQAKREMEKVVLRRVPSGKVEEGESKDKEFDKLKLGFNNAEYNSTLKHLNDLKIGLEEKALRGLQKIDKYIDA